MKLRKILNESRTDIINQLLQSMIDNKIQRKTLKIKDIDKFNQFLEDIKPFVDDDLLMAKTNPIDKTEVWLSLGPKSQNKIN